MERTRGAVVWDWKQALEAIFDWEVLKSWIESQAIAMYEEPSLMIKRNHGSIMFYERTESVHLHYI